MTTNEPIQNLIIPTLAEAADVPKWIAKAYDDLLRRAIPRFVSQSALELAIPTPSDGQSAITGTGTTARWWVGLGGQWRSFARASGNGLWSAEMPPSGQASGAANVGQVPFSQTTFADVAGTPTLVIDLPAPALVHLSAGMWLGKTDAAIDIRCGLNVTGATISAPQSPNWGAVAIHQVAAAGSLQFEVSKDVEFAAGETTVKLQAQRNGGASGAQATCSYTKAAYQVTRWL